MELDKELIRQLAKEGKPILHIAREFGIPRWKVYNIILESGQKHFRPIMPGRCIYVNLRNWMNENRVSRDELIRRMGLEVNESTRNKVKNFMYGRVYPSVHEISLYMEASGLPYEELMETDGCYTGD